MVKKQAHIRDPYTAKRQLTQWLSQASLVRVTKDPYTGFLSHERDPDIFYMFVPKDSAKPASSETAIHPIWVFCLSLSCVKYFYRLSQASFLYKGLFYRPTTLFQGLFYRPLVFSIQTTLFKGIFCRLSQASFLYNSFFYRPTTLFQGLFYRPLVFSIQTTLFKGIFCRLSQASFLYKQHCLRVSSIDLLWFNTSNQERLTRLSVCVCMCVCVYVCMCVCVYVCMCVCVWVITNMSHKIKRD